jgi:hypothetical protein
MSQVKGLEKVGIMDAHVGLQRRQMLENQSKVRVSDGTCGQT